MAVVYPSLVEVIQTDTFEEWRIKTNSMIAHAEAAAANICLLYTSDAADEP